MEASKSMGFELAAIEVNMAEASKEEVLKM
jgi:hypothetical protein